MALKRHTNGAAEGEERDPGLSRVYGEAAREQPPAHLDAAIRAAARREVGARPRPAGLNLRAWRAPVAIAAVIVLSVSLVTLMRNEGREQVAETAPEAALSKPSEVAPPAGRSVQVAPRAETRVPAPVRPFPGAPAVPEHSAVATPREPGAVPAPRAERESAPPAAVPQAAGRAQSETGALRRERPSAAAPKPAAPAAPGAGRPKFDDGLDSTAADAASRDGRPLWLSLEREPPRKWLERIAELRRQGKTEEAEEVLAEFKRRFPDHSLPGGPR